MIIEHNITERRGPEHCLRWSRQPAAVYTEPTGFTEEYEMTGHFEALRNKAAGMASAPLNSVGLSLELSRAGGTFGRLRITETYYQTSSEQEGDDPGNSGSNESPGDSENTPSYSVSFVRTEENILSHPKFEAVVGVQQYAEALNLLMTGGRLSDYVYDAYAPQNRRSLRELFEDASGPLALVLDKIVTGKHRYVATRPVVTARWKVPGPGSISASPGIVKTVPGGYPTPAGCDWLCVPGGVEDHGGVYWATATYECSGPGGWDKDIYPSS